MLFKRISRASAETVFLVAKNVSGSTMTANYSVVWDVGASVDGVRVSQADTADLQAYAGVADSDIANNDFGLLQVYGYRASVFVHSSAGSSVAGDDLTVINSEWGLQPATSQGANKAFGFLCEAIASSASSSLYDITVKGFIRAL